jgi:hypothetical protein
MGLIVIPICVLILCIGGARGFIKMNTTNTRVENLERMLNVLDSHLEMLNEIENSSSASYNVKPNK